MKRSARRSFGLAVATAVIAGPAAAFEPVAVLTGEVTAKDGDGLLFGDIEVRLNGIAAPEFRSNKKDPGGREALEALAGMANGQAVRCELDGSTANRRPVGVCFVDDLDLNAEMVRRGVARDCPAYSNGRYADEEREARNAGYDLSRIYRLPDYC